MTAARYWKVAGVVPRVPGTDLTLGDVALYDGTTRVDGSATLTCTAVPIAGALGAAGVTFAVADATAPGFALVWDFGSAQSVTELRLTDNGICELVVLASDDAQSWVRRGDFAGIPAGVVTVRPSDGDPNFDKVALLLHFDGVGAGFVDSSPFAHAISSSGVVHSASQVRFGTAAGYFNGSSHLTVPAHSSFQVGASNYTVEAWVMLTGTSNPYPHLCSLTDASGDNQVRLFVNSSRQPAMLVYVGNVLMVAASGSSTLLLNTWHHLSMARFGALHLLFLDGALVATSTGTYTLSAPLDVKVGAVQDSAGANYKLQGYLDELRITANGVARYTEPFTPQGSAFPSVFGEQPYAPVARPLGVDVPPSAPQIALFTPPDFTVTAPTDVVAIDGEDGGWHRIVGTVKEKNLPANTPLARKVQLYHQTSGRLVRETWSAPGDGSYSFNEIRGGQPYFVVAFDHTGTYRAVIADNLLPEAMYP